MITHTIKPHCISCGGNVVECSDPARRQNPEPGDPIVCQSCAAIQTIDENGNYRGMRKDEVEQLFSHPEVVRVVSEYCALIRARNFARHRRN